MGRKYANKELVFYCYITLFKIYIKYSLIEEDINFAKGKIITIIREYSNTQIKNKKNLLLCHDFLKYSQNSKWINTTLIQFMINSLNITCKN